MNPQELRKDFFFCYDKKLKDFLIDNDIWYIVSAINPKSNRKYWLFYSGEELTRLTQIFKKLKEN